MHMAENHPISMHIVGSFYCPFWIAAIPIHLSWLAGHSEQMLLNNAKAMSKTEQKNKRQTVPNRSNRDAIELEQYVLDCRHRRQMERWKTFLELLRVLLKWAYLIVPVLLGTNLIQSKWLMLFRRFIEERLR